MLIDANGIEKGLELKAWRLIILFCQHQQQIVTRDEIVEGIYDGVVVSDNAVNKIVAKVRKLLDDDAGNSRFIKTIPKQGYSLIADIEEIATLTPAKNLKRRKSHIYYYICIIFVLLVSGLLLFTLDNEQKEHFINKKLSALTSSIGVESAPYLSPDANYLVYQKHSPQKAIHQWWIKRLDKQLLDRKLPIENHSSPIAWSNQKRSFLYVEHQEECVVYEMSIDADQQASREITNCGDNWISHLLYAGNESGFYYVARKEIHDSWQVFFYSFEAGESGLINQPIAEGVGNYAIDLSPKKDKLLILSSNSDSSTALYELVLESNQLVRKGNRNWPLARAIWHHDNERVIHTSQRYARELLITDIDEKSEKTLVSTSNRVSENFKRHPNNFDYYFTSFQMNNNLIHYSDGKENNIYLDNSEVYEKFPVYRDSANAWYFVSNRSGISQIFSSSSVSKATKQVSNFENEYEFTSLDASMNGKRLAFHDAKYLTIFESDTGKHTRYETPLGNIVSSSWLGNKKISISISHEANTHVYIFDIDKEAFSETSSRWQAIFSGNDTTRRFAVESSTNKLFEVNENHDAIQPLKIGNHVPIDYTGLQVRATKDALVYAKKKGVYTELVSYGVNTHTEKSLGKWLYVAGFDVFRDNLILSFEESRTGDVMRTHLVIAD